MRSSSGKTDAFRVQYILGVICNSVRISARVIGTLRYARIGSFELGFELLLRARARKRERERASH